MAVRGEAQECTFTFSLAKSDHANVDMMRVPCIVDSLIHAEINQKWKNTGASSNGKISP